MENKHKVKPPSPLIARREPLYNDRTMVLGGAVKFKNRPEYNRVKRLMLEDEK